MKIPSDDGELTVVQFFVRYIRNFLRCPQITVHVEILTCKSVLQLHADTVCEACSLVQYLKYIRNTYIIHCNFICNMYYNTLYRMATEKLKIHKLYFQMKY